MNQDRILTYLHTLYPEEAENAYLKIQAVISQYENKKKQSKWLSENDIMLITYGDTIKKAGEMPLKTLYDFLSTYAPNTVTAVHLLPCFPYTSDDGFSVVDYKEINPVLGNWNDIAQLNVSYDLMLDAVINHSSKSCPWFVKFCEGDPAYQDYYLSCDPDADYSKVTRPRALPLLTPFETAKGTQYLWTTFSADQVDLNYKSPALLAQVIDILLFYAVHGARFIRLDAIGFAWKKAGTSCMHLKETHTLVKLFRAVLEEFGSILITETNVPHADNISYFGDGTDEAQLVYQFPLPPLVLYSYLAKDARHLTDWAQQLAPPKNGTAFFNFLASHDGIGMRPIEGILSETERQLLVDKCLAHGGQVSYKDNGDGTQSPYELNISLQDALTAPNDNSDKRIKRMLGAHMLLLSLAGMPGIYIHSLLGSRNDRTGMLKSGINRRINREQLDNDRLVRELGEGSMRGQIFEPLCQMIRIRRSHTAFAPDADQKILHLDNRIFAVLRHNHNSGEKILALINVSEEQVTVSVPGTYVELLTKTPVCDHIKLDGLDFCWLQIDETKAADKTTS